MRLDESGCRSEERSDEDREALGMLGAWKNREARHMLGVPKSLVCGSDWNEKATSGKRGTFACA